MPSATQLYNTGKMLNAADLAGNPQIGLNKRVPAIIHNCQPEQIGQGADQKTMLMLDLVSKQGQAWPKRMPLNKTNTLTLVAAFGDDFGLWPSKAVEIWAENVMFSGKIVPGLKIQAQANGAGPAVPVPAPAPPPSQPSSATAVAGVSPLAGPARMPIGTPIEDDEIPF